MEQHKKTFIGSIITFFIGTSCCWLSSLAIWLGGAAFVGGIVKFIESIQWQLILVSVLLAILSMYFYFKNKRRKQAKSRS